MSSELERVLREARNRLPESGGEARERARAQALQAVTTRRRRRPTLAVVGAVAVALVLGIAIGASRAPTGTAAAGPGGFGFLPAHEWYVVQNGGLATADRPAIATAANVPIRPGDGASILPYATLQSLPADGVVLVASIVTEGSASTAAPVRGSAETAVRVSAAVAIEQGTQIRPQQPLGQYQLRASVEGYAVDVYLYFGTPAPSAGQRGEAQRQLDLLVLRPNPEQRPPPEVATVASATARSAQSIGFRAVRTFDRSCNCYRLQFSGRISAPVSGEYVSVLRQQCGTSFGTAVAGAQTQAGGYWEATTMFSPPPDRESATYWARWNDTESTRVRFRGRLFVSLDALGRGRFRATVQTAEAPQQLAGRTILLQRRTAGGWVLARSTRLRPDASIPGAAFATFVYPQKRHELRALVPSASARPCFTASPSATVRS
jgi:hypothetical protein